MRRRKQRALTLVVALALACPVLATTITLRDGAINPVTGQAYAGTEDVMIIEWAPASNFGGRGDFDVGNASATQSAHTLIRFDLSSLAGIAKEITSATLRLTESSAGYSPAGAGTVQLYRLADVNASWVEGTFAGTGAGNPADGQSIWNSRNAHTTSPTPWAGSVGASTPGTDYVNTVLASYPYTTATTGTIALPVAGDLSFIDTWVAGGTNAGFYLKNAIENTTNRINFVSRNGAAAARPELVLSFTPAVTHIPLGNLFDDANTGVTLAQAIATDAYRAGADATDLGVDRYQTGNLQIDAVVAPGITFNFLTAGGGPYPGGQPANDSWRTSGNALRTQGNKPDPYPATKVEDGLGLHGSGFVTFDVDEIRDKGGLDPDAAFWFVAKAGVNDDSYGSGARLRTVALVSDANSLLAGYVNGIETDITQAAGVYSFTGAIPAELTSDGVFAYFNVLVPGNADYLTLAITEGANPSSDHGVFSGAMLVVVPEPCTLTLLGLGSLTALIRRRFSSSN